MPLSQARPSAARAPIPQTVPAPIEFFGSHDPPLLQRNITRVRLCRIRTTGRGEALIVLKADVELRTEEDSYRTPVNPDDENDGHPIKHVELFCSEVVEVEAETTQERHPDDSRKNGAWYGDTSRRRYIRGQEKQQLDGGKREYGSEEPKEVWPDGQPQRLN